MRWITGLAAMLVMLLPDGAIVYAQTSEGEEVVQLSADELGPFRPASRADLDVAEQEIAELTNEFRKEQGLATVHSDSRLHATAQDFAEYMARTDRYGHTADGRSSSQRVKPTIILTA